MKTIKSFAVGTFATVVLASASIPALAWTVWPDVDFEWYANVGRPLATTPAIEIVPASRTDYIWAPGRWESPATGSQVWVSGHWINDDFEQQKLVYGTYRPQFATGSPFLRDSEGNVIPTDPYAYPVGSARK